MTVAFVAGTETVVLVAGTVDGIVPVVAGVPVTGVTDVTVVVTVPVVHQRRRNSVQFGTNCAAAIVRTLDSQGRESTSIRTGS